MTPEAFCGWLEHVKELGLAATDREAGQLLGVTPNSVVNMKHRGADQRTALACSAVILRLTPYRVPSEKPPRREK